MTMSDLIKQGIVRKTSPNNARAQSLLEMSAQTMKVILTLDLNEQNTSIIFRELYECLRQALEAIGYKNGYKFENHESIKIFASEILQNNELAIDFDRYRKIRNGINYYGDKVAVETAKKAAENIPKYFKEISDK